MSKTYVPSTHPAMSGPLDVATLYDEIVAQPDILGAPQEPRRCLRLIRGRTGEVIATRVDGGGWVDCHGQPRTGALECVAAAGYRVMSYSLRDRSGSVRLGAP